MVCPLLPLSVWVRAIAGRHSTKNQILQKKKIQGFTPPELLEKNLYLPQNKIWGMLPPICFRNLKATGPEDYKTAEPEDHRREKAKCGSLIFLIEDT